jgi:hypothetical protein
MFVILVVARTRMAIIMTPTTALVKELDPVSVSGSHQLTGQLLEFGLSLPGLTLVFLLLGHGCSHHLLSAFG